MSIPAGTMAAWAEQQAADTAPNSHAGPHLAVVTMANVVPERVSWLWPGRIPFGKITVLDGDPNLGKSTVTLDLAARVSTGSPLPTGERPRRGAVLLLSAEDGAGDTIRPRLEASGADLARIHLLDHVTDEQGPRPVELPTDLPAIEALIVAQGIVLLVVDPFMAFLSGAVNSKTDQDIRRAMHPLKELAERTGVAVLVVRHLNKSGESNALYRGGGSIGIIGAARSGMLVAPDPHDAARRVLAMTKHNLAPPADSLAYRLVPAEPYAVARVQWEGTVASSADDLLVRQEPETPERQEAADFLRAELASGPATWKVLVKRAADQDIKQRTLERARDAMKAAGLVDKRQVGRPGEPGMFWEWFLAEQTPTSPDPGK
jgi:RecA-family ATPase